EYERTVGKLVEVDRVALGSAHAYAAAARALQRVPDMLAGRLAAESDARKCRALMATEIQTILTELADKIGGLPGSAEP
ncbi:MAG: hypothetical protein ABI831_12810, partial [Betaproteobacteria bacterium]